MWDGRTFPVEASGVAWPGEHGLEDRAPRVSCILRGGGRRVQAIIEGSTWRAQGAGDLAAWAIPLCSRTCARRLGSDALGTPAGLSRFDVRRRQKVEENAGDGYKMDGIMGEREVGAEVGVVENGGKRRRNEREWGFDEDSD